MEPQSTSLYIPRGRGILYIAAWSGTTPPSEGDLVQIGNCPSIEVEPTVEKDPHYTSQEGMRLKDLDPIVETNYTVNFETDQIASGNISRFLMGTLNQSTRTIAVMQNITGEYFLKFVSNNPKGPNYITYFWRVSLAPNGPMPLIGDEYLTLSFTAEGLADLENHPSSPYFDWKMITTTTTSSTTTTTTA